MKKKIAFAMVSGSGNFPLDMLRYDSCCPATEEDSYLIGNSFNNYDYNWTVCVKKILLEPLSKKDLHTCFTEGRWQSFGCKVEMVESPYEVPRKSLEN